jgi:hypothetical protein
LALGFVGGSVIFSGSSFGARASEAFRAVASAASPLTSSTHATRNFAVSLRYKVHSNLRDRERVPLASDDASFPLERSCRVSLSFASRYFDLALED